MSLQSTVDRQRAERLFGHAGITVLPYVGERYGLRPRILLLLESQYSPTEADNGVGSISGERLAFWNVDLLSWHVSRQESQKLLTKVGRLVRSFVWPEEDDEREILRRVMFYNFIQAMIRRGTSATAYQVQSSMEPFARVLEVADPDIIISFGRRRVRGYIEAFARGRGIHVGNSAEFKPFRIGNCIVLNTAHPASQFSYSEALSELRSQISTSMAAASAFRPDGSVCPTCGGPGRNSTRYPGAVCRECEVSAVDLEGNFVRNLHEFQEKNLVVRGIGCSAREARFGGTVIQPMACWANTVC